MISTAQMKVQYLPFYGGAKGQYLEIKKDNRGIITSEKIVLEDKLTNDNTKYYDDESQSVSIRILTKNLQILQQSSTDLLRIVNLGKKTGYLNNQDKVKFKSSLASIGESVSNIVKVMDGTGDDVNSLFKNNDHYHNDRCSQNRRLHHEEHKPQHKSRSEDLKEKSLSLRRFKQQFDDEEEDVGEEGVGIDAEDSGGYDDDVGGRGLIAEAKPFGLAVIGDHGIALAKPEGTAVAASGVAVARPIGTAIAGVDPLALGINFQVNKQRRI